MTAQTKPIRRTTERPLRHTFSVRDQIRGKLGAEGYDTLYDRLKAAAKPRRQRRRKPVLTK